MQNAWRDEVLLVGELEIRPHEYLALARGRALRLSVRELGVLTALARRAGRIVGRDDLYAMVWGGTLRPDDRTVDVYVHRLRSKLAHAVPDRRFIHTHVGFGYRLAPEPFTPFSHDHRESTTASTTHPWGTQ